MSKLFFILMMNINSKLNIVIPHACGLSGHSPFLSPMQKLSSVMLTHALTHRSDALHLFQVLLKLLRLKYFWKMYPWQMYANDKSVLEMLFNSVAIYISICNYNNIHSWGFSLNLTWMEEKNMIFHLQV